MENSAIKHILVVEDDDISQFLIQKMMDDLGFKHHIVSNGLDAIEVLEKTPFDLVLMDIEMPIINGFETTRRIRNSDNSINRHIPIIGISANPLENNIESYVKMGMNDYISKPIHELDLKLKIENQLDK